MSKVNQTKRMNNSWAEKIEVGAVPPEVDDEKTSRPGVVEPERSWPIRPGWLVWLLRVSDHLLTIASSANAPQKRVRTES